MEQPSPVVTPTTPRLISTGSSEYGHPLYRVLNNMLPICTGCYSGYADPDWTGIPGVGFKVSDSEIGTRNVYYNARVLADCGIGPQVYGRLISVLLPGGHINCESGYFENDRLSSSSSSSRSSSSSSSSVSSAELKTMRKGFGFFIQDLSPLEGEDYEIWHGVEGLFEFIARFIHCECSDLHSRNVGLDDRGRLLILDSGFEGAAECPFCGDLTESGGECLCDESEVYWSDPPLTSTEAAALWHNLWACRLTHSASFNLLTIFVKDALLARDRDTLRDLQGVDFLADPDDNETTEKENQ